MSKNGSNISVTVGTPWFTLWLVTIAMAHLGFWRGALAVLIWPYYLGEVIAKAIGQ